MTDITWLHLSDWHQRGNEFNRRVIRDGLITDIHNRRGISPDLARVDFVIFSGDIAYSGQKEEYSAAAEFLLEPLLQELQLDACNLFIVPGNHDIDHQLFRYLPQELTAPLESEEQVQDWLSDKNRHYILEPFQAFEEFVSGFTGQAHPAYAATRIVERSDIHIGLLGLNSALMSARYKDGEGNSNDYGKLVIGELQLYDALKQLDACDITLAVLHHPFSWLFEFDANHAEERLREKCHFILHGHHHKPGVQVEMCTMGKSVIIPAGASYGTRLVDDPRYINAYNFVHVDFTTSEGTIYLRRWSDQRNTFREDIDSFPQGRFAFTLDAAREEPPKELPEPVYGEIVIDTSMHNLIPTETPCERFLTFSQTHHAYITAATDATLAAFLPFRQHSRINAAHCTSALDELQKVRQHIDELYKLLITTTLIPPPLLKDQQHNMSHIAQQREDLIASVQHLRSSRYVLSAEQFTTLRDEIRARFENLLQELAQLDILSS